jgi:hypothetical protein
LWQDSNEPRKIRKAVAGVHKTERVQLCALAAASCFGWACRNADMATGARAMA